MSPLAGESTTLVDICIATRKRPAMLRRLLESLTRQRTLGGLRFRVIVIDNDVERSAAPVVEAVRATGLDLVYDVEPERNISLARNRAIAHSRPDADYIATIDDDAEAPAHWLATMLETARRHDAAVVFGAVRRVLPPDAPEHIVRSGVFQLYNPPTGSTEWLVYNTANALLRREAALWRPGPFRPDYGRTGGEDTELFFSLRQAGHKIVWCREAEVNESVSPERVSLRWLLPRSFREGVTYYKVYRRWILSPSMPLPWRWLPFGWWMLRTGAAIAWGAIVGLVSTEQRARAVANAKAAAFHLGIASRTLGLRFEPRHS